MLETLAGHTMGVHHGARYYFLDICVRLYVRLRRHIGVSDFGHGLVRGWYYQLRG